MLSHFYGTKFMCWKINISNPICASRWKKSDKQILNVYCIFEVNHDLIVFSRLSAGKTNFKQQNSDNTTSISSLSHRGKLLQKWQRNLNTCSFLSFLIFAIIFLAVMSLIIPQKRLFSLQNKVFKQLKIYMRSRHCSLSWHVTNLSVTHDYTSNDLAIVTQHMAHFKNKQNQIYHKFCFYFSFTWQSLLQCTAMHINLSACLHRKSKQCSWCHHHHLHLVFI